LERADQVLKSRNGVRFTTYLRTSLNEPREVDLRLDYVESEMGTILVGKASARPADEISKLCNIETQRYIIGNYIVLADLLSHRLTETVKHYVDEPTFFAMQSGLREMLINAIEHGNLEITFDEKTKAQEAGKYYDLLKERQADARFSARTVTVDYSFDAHEFRVQIADQGPGFDHRKVAALNVDDLLNEGLLHGRGIILTKTQFDEVSYNEAGNQVTLVKRIL
ncbi:MAG: ATP-binding protein, partial [Spirochaetia bacterium]|nr:ATP-binding protein [Spirochaetia bacterium]